MKEFVEKLIGRLEELNLDGIRMIEDGKYELIRKKEAIEIVNQLAEEYNNCSTNISTDKSTTNADRIRSMSDEELAEFLGEFEVCNVCKYLGDRGECELDSIFLCEKGFAVAIAKDWLQSEVKGSE